MSGTHLAESATHYWHMRDFATPTLCDVRLSCYQAERERRVPKQSPPPEMRGILSPYAMSGTHIASSSTALCDVQY
eukprot:1378888-Rhodomonas_salina.3